MNHQDHVALIQPALMGAGLTWADLGSGGGAFTLAAREVLGPTIQLYSVDINALVLEQQRQQFAQQFPGSKIKFIQADFTHELALPELDGIIMANSLHFVPYAQQLPLLKRLRMHLKPNGRLVIVEYASDRGNAWVPNPHSFKRLAQMMADADFQELQQVSDAPSEFMQSIYCAVAYR